jgi:phosphotransferase system HPr-like phosphotransfer protein
MSKNLLQEFKELTEDLANDIRLATHREEHIRVTARANKAQEILTRLEEGIEIVLQERQEESALKE